MFKLGQPWIPLDRVEAFIQLEPALAIASLAVGAWLAYKLLLRDLLPERHRSLRRHFANLAAHAGAWAAFFATYAGLSGQEGAERILPYLGLATVFWGAIVFVKTSRILLFEYLFLGHMRVGVPVLLINLFTLLLSVVVAGWLVSEIFSVRLTPILATSAIFSIILGLALQDTLGNLFAGVALQIDKPYEIGDWVEIHSDSQRWVGQVHEITWRATVLVGLSDEALTIPNRVVAQAQIANFSLKSRPILRRQIFRIPFGTTDKQVKAALVRAATGVPLVRQDPAPYAIVCETAESWLEYRLVYFIDDYGNQFTVADQVISAAVVSLEREGVPLAGPRLTVNRV